MSASVNKVILIGNLGRDPEIKQNATGQKIGLISIATKSRSEEGAAMTDLVVTIPRETWAAFAIERGQPAPVSTLRGFHLFGCNEPQIGDGDRLYFVAGGVLRGFSLAERVRPVRGGFAIMHRTAFTPRTLAEGVAGFRGWRRVWWQRADEHEFKTWNGDVEAPL